MRKHRSPILVIALFLLVGGVYHLTPYGFNSPAQSQDKTAVNQAADDSSSYDPYALDIINAKTDGEIEEILNNLEVLSRLYSQTGMLKPAAELDSIRTHILEHTPSRRVGFIAPD